MKGGIKENEGKLKPLTAKHVFVHFAVK